MLVVHGRAVEISTAQRFARHADATHRLAYVWTTTSDGQLHCAEHGQTFSRISACSHPNCQPTGATEPERDAPDDPQIAADESWCRTQRDALIELAVQMADERDERGAIDRAGYSTVAKLYDTALKYHRAATEERRARNDKEHELFLIDQHRRMKEKAH